MLSFFRSMAKSKVLAVLLGVPLLAGLLTIGSVRADLGNVFARDAVITAGSRVYTSADFKREFESYRRESQQQGQPITAEDAVAQGLDQRMLGAFAERESMSQMLHKLGVWPSDKLVVEQIAKIKAFFDPISGKFDQKTYIARLQENGLTPATFEKNLRDEVAFNHFASGVAAGLRAPRLYGSLVGAFGFEVHNLSLFAINPKILGEEPKPTDADLLKIMKANAAALTDPETRTLTLVRFSAQQIAPTVTADPAEVKKRYDFRKDTLSSQEARSLVQISVKTPQQAAEVAAQLRKGYDPTAVAKSVGSDPLNYANAIKTSIADPKVADVAFALPAGAVSDPIQGQLGLAVVKVLKVTPGHTVSFEDAKAQIEQEVKAAAAADKANDQAQKFEEAHEKGSTLAEAAKAAGAAPVQVGPVSSQGNDADGKPSGLSPRLLKEAFALPQGGETDAVQDSKGEYFAVRVDKIIPPALPTLDKVRPRLTEFFLQQEMSKRLDAKLNELSARVKKGESLDAVAQSVGSAVTHLSITRTQAQQSRNLRPEQVNQIFAAKTGEVFATGAVVARIDSITPPPAGVIAATLPGGQVQMSRGIFEEMQQEGRAWAKTQVKPKINITLARQAIGVQPSDGKGAAGAPLGKTQ
ncbi:MAG: rotamase [Caulobacteraceae bacterium]|nr:rotamase [Caulobacteraceae bacterium]